MSEQRTKMLDTLAGLESPMSSGVGKERSNVNIDPEKLMKAWLSNTETQRLIIEKADAQEADNVRTRRDNSITRWEVRIGVMLVLMAAAWAVQEQRMTRATITAGAVTLSRVDDNVKSLSMAQVKTNEAIAKKAEADIELHPQAAEEALEAVIEAQAEAAEAAIEIARVREEPSPPEAVEALKEAKAKKRRLKSQPSSSFIPMESAPEME